MYVFIVSVADFMYSQVSFPIMFLNGTNDSFFLGWPQALVLEHGCDPL